MLEQLPRCRGKLRLSAHLRPRVPPASLPQQRGQKNSAGASSRMLVLPGYLSVCVFSSHLSTTVPAMRRDVFYTLQCMQRGYNC